VEGGAKFGTQRIFIKLQPNLLLTFQQMLLSSSERFLHASRCHLWQILHNSNI